MTKERVRLTLIDGPTLLLEIGGLRILPDPTFDEPQVYSSGPIRIQKFNSPVQSAESLLPINAVLLSHDQHGAISIFPGGRFFLERRW